MNKKLASIATGATLMLLTAAPAFAADLFEGPGSITDQTGSFAENIGIGGTETDLKVVIAGVVNTILSFLGIIAILIILYGGFKWMTSGGEEEKTKDAKKIMVAGLIGLLIILGAYAIASFVIGQIVGALR
jgi:hypothetical protein